MDKTYGELIKLNLWIIRLRWSLQTSASDIVKLNWPTINLKYICLSSSKGGDCWENYSFDDNKLFKEQLGILIFVQVCRIIKLKSLSELILLKVYVVKLNVSNSDGSESDESERSTSKRLGSSHDTSSSGDNSDYRVLSLKNSAFGSYYVPI